MEMDYPEGATPLDPDEMEGLKLRHIETRGELDQVEQQNIQEGFNWLTRQRKYKEWNRGYAHYERSYNFNPVLVVDI